MKVEFLIADSDHPCNSVSSIVVTEGNCLHSYVCDAVNGEWWAWVYGKKVPISDERRVKLDAAMIAAYELNLLEV